jgi:hypothetical protein
MSPHDGLLLLFLWYVSYVKSPAVSSTLTLQHFLCNRTQFYASPRVPLHLKWPVRLGVYLLPIISIIYQIQWLLQGIRCQLSPNWPQLRYGNPEKKFSLDYAGEGGFLYKMASMALFWQSEEASCANVHMTNGGGQRPAGSLALLWPLFLSLCLSAFVETLACALQGRQPVGDTKMMELSLAFAEAESMVLKPFELAFAGKGSADITADSNPLDRKILLQAMNVSPEMLIISLLWACNNLSSMILSVFGLRNKYRLLNTGFWGITYFIAISWSIFHLYTASETSSDIWIFRFPTVFLVGFFPHLIVIVGITACALVYGVALLLTALSLPTSQNGPVTFGEKIAAAYHNLQANVHFSHATPLRFRMSDDFYTTLLTTGFTILTAASEAVYLNEGAKVRVSNLTWLERKRVQELQRGLLFMKTRSSIPTELLAASNDKIEALSGNAPPSGYAVERKPRSQEQDKAMADMRGGNGRWAMATRLLHGTLWLILGLYAKMLLFTLEKLGVTWRPQWLRRAVGDNAKQKGSLNGSDRHAKDVKRDFWMRSDDVEVEVRRRFPYATDVDDQLYDRWKRGEWWGNTDTSGDYQAPMQDEDTSSVISISTTTSEAESNPDWDSAWEDVDGNRDGARTPTQLNFTTPPSREVTPEPMFDAEQLATLLDPRTAEEQQEARMLAQRLRRPGIMTRSQYRRQMHQERAAVLSSSRYGPQLNLDALGSPISTDDEERLLEQFILSRREAKRSKVLNTESSSIIAANWGSTSGANSDDWNNGAEGMGSSGPQCVVCQDSPRTILLWPCGCLCLCDECRVNMAARNFASCVCCRTPTVAYSRLYVP